MPHVSIESQGRCGTLTYHEAAHTLACYWEFGGGDAVAVVQCGSAADWARTPVGTRAAQRDPAIHRRRNGAPAGAVMPCRNRPGDGRHRVAPGDASGSAPEGQDNDALHRCTSLLPRHLSWEVVCHLRRERQRRDGSSVSPRCACTWDWPCWPVRCGGRGTVDQGCRVLHRPGQGHRDRLQRAHRPPHRHT